MPLRAALHRRDRALPHTSTAAAGAERQPCRRLLARADLNGVGKTFYEIDNVLFSPARALGDMVTIILTEATTTAKSTTGKTSREGSFGITPPTAGPLDFLNPQALKAAAEGSFTGGGNAAQQSRLNGAVAVTIAAIYPNGTAEVVGEKQMMFSQGEEWVQFAGRIRLVDIDSDNRLASSQVANARIIYSGKGAVQQASRPGWLSRFFNLISPL